VSISLGTRPEWPAGVAAFPVLGIEDAKTAETRERRIVKAVERLKSGRGQR
jgi:hypothetical protein